MDFKVTAVKPDTQDCFKRAFAMPRAAAEPSFQMAWWVVAMTYKHSLWNCVWPVEAREALKTITAEDKLSVRKRAFVDAVRVL